MDELIKAQFQRVDDEQVRQNRRLEKLEEAVTSMNELVLSVQKLSLNMEQMLKEQVKQGERLRKLEDAPLASLNSAKQTAINTFIGAIVGVLVTGIFVLMKMGA